jgi:hypothetical protein
MNNSKLNMKNLKYFFLPILFSLSSCYIYKPYTEKEGIAQGDNSSNSQNKGISVRDQNTSKATATPVTRNVGPGVGGGSANSLAEKGMTPEDKLKLKEEQQNQQGQPQNPSANQNMSGKVAPPTSPVAGNDANKGQMSFGKDPNPINQGKPDRTTMEKPNIPVGAGLKEKIQPNKYYKITVENKEYKIQAEKWEGDTLVSHILRKPNRVLKFHENQIDEELLKERRFSKVYSDLFTVGAYAAGGAAVLLLLL